MADIGVITELAERVAALETRDAVQTAELKAVDERASIAARFVRRVIIGAIGTIAGSLIAAAVLIFNAGVKSAESKAALNQQHAEVLSKVGQLEESLTDLRSQVRLLLRSRLDRDNP